MALAARKTQKSGTVDRQPKIDGDENMRRVHKLINIDDAFAATSLLNVAIKHFDCNKTSVNIFSVQKYSTDFEC